MHVNLVIKGLYPFLKKEADKIMPEKGRRM
jgi:hypothetical protein